LKPENDKALCEAFPLLYADRVKSVYETPMGRGFECDDGWFNLIRELSGKLEDILSKVPHEERFFAFQVKQKFGGLRFYLRGQGHHYDEADAIIKEYASLSFKTCEVCGSPGTRRTSLNYIQVLCDAHEDARWEAEGPENRARIRSEYERRLKLKKRRIVELEGQLRNANSSELAKAITEELEDETTVLESIEKAYAVVLKYCSKKQKTGP